MQMMSDVVDTSGFHPTEKPTLSLAEQRIESEIWHITS
jgi:hypothetical protein